MQISPLLLAADHTRPITAPFLPTPLAQQSSPILLSVAFCPTHFCYVFAGTRPPLASILIAAQVQAQGFFCTLRSGTVCRRNHRLSSIYRLGGDRRTNPIARERELQIRQRLLADHASPISVSISSSLPTFPCRRLCNADHRPRIHQTIPSKPAAFAATFHC